MPSRFLRSSAVWLNRPTRSADAIAAPRLAADHRAGSAASCRATTSPPRPASYPPRHPGRRQPGATAVQRPAGPRAGRGCPASERPDGAARRRRARIRPRRPMPTGLVRLVSATVPASGLVLPVRPGPVWVAHESSLVGGSRLSQAIGSARQHTLPGALYHPGTYCAIRTTAGQARRPGYLTTSDLRPWPLTRWPWPGDYAGWSARRCRARRRTPGGSRHNSGRPRPRRPGTLHIPRPFRPVLDPA